MPESLDVSAAPRPTGFNVLEHWGSWTSSRVPNEAGDAVVTQVNATGLHIRIEFTKDGEFFAHTTINIDGQDVLGLDRDAWNAFVASTKSMSNAQMAAEITSRVKLKEFVRDVATRTVEQS
jgi:hypothetical protein